MSLKAIIRYFFRHKSHLNHGGRLISPYSLAGATEDEKLLILAGVARSPEDARFLMAKYQTNSPAEVLKHIKTRKFSTTPGTRLINLIRRIEGHDPRDPYGGKPGAGDQRLEVRYRYRSPRW